MAITYTWEINGRACKRDLADGYYTNVGYRVIGMDDTTEKARATGDIVFTKPDSLPSDFISYDTSAKTPVPIRSSSLSPIDTPSVSKRPVTVPPVLVVSKRTSAPCLN